MLKNIKSNDLLKKIIITAIWLLIWQLASALTGLELLLAGPVNVFKALIELLCSKVFYEVIINSFLKITAGFAAGFVAGCITGAFSGRYRLVEQFLNIPVQLMKTVPVTSFIILLLIWFGSDNVAAFISFIVVYPAVHISVISGIRNLDVSLSEMAQVFDIYTIKKIRCIYVPQIIPYIETSLKTVVGMSWKAGVSAEIIGLTKSSVGEQLYYSKLYLMTAQLFAWSIVVVAVSFVFEKIFIYVMCFALKRVCSPQAFCDKSRRKHKNAEKPQKMITVDNLSKSYGSNKIFEDVTFSVERGMTVGILGSSGIGKTTLLRLICRLEVPDIGLISGTGRASAVFQENRLISNLSAVDNVLLVSDKGGTDVCRAAAKRELEKLLPGDCIHKPVNQLSGGMQRRVAIVRAFMAESDTIFLDEPFTGLDKDNKSVVYDYIKDNKNKRTIFIVTHNEEDLLALEADICLLTSAGSVATILRNCE